MQQAQSRFRAEVSKAKLTFAEDKNVEETVEATITLGYEANLQTGIVRADSAKMSILMSDTAKIARCHRVTTREWASGLIFWEVD